MVGAAFVLGKLTAPESEIGGSASGASVSIKSASPGIVMAVLGTILIGIALVMPVTTDVRDAAIYFGRAETPAEDPPSLEVMNPATDADSPPRQPAVQEKRP
jgi:hypothetical protein